MTKEKNNMTSMPKFTADESLGFVKSSYREEITLMSQDSISPAFDGRAQCIADCTDREYNNCITIRAMEYAGRIPFASQSPACFANVDSTCNAQCPPQGVPVHF